MKRHRKTAFAIALVLAFGTARMPFEATLAREHRAANLRGGNLDLAMREQVSQKLAVAVFGGFRSLVASVLSLQAYNAWEYVQWGDVEAIMEVATQLQPGVESYWRSANAYLAYDAASYYTYDAALPEAARARRRQDAVERGLRFLKDGFRNNPDSYRIAADIAEVYRRRVEPPDYCSAADWLEIVLSIEGHPTPYRRLYAYDLAECPGRERQAYAHLRTLFLESERHHKPRLVSELGRLETELDIPADKRLVNR